MKKNFFSQIGLLLLAVIMVTGCQKQFPEPETPDDAFLKSGSNANVENKYRLLVDKGLSDGFLQWYHYNENGLADEFHIFKPDIIDWWATMEYDNRNIMSKARFFYSTDDFYDIVFTWEKNQLVKETWFVPGTENIADYIVNSYNGKGQLVKKDDPPYELYTIFQYDAVGNCSGWKIFDYQDNLYYAVDFSYSGPVKNPFTSVTGWPISLFFLDDISSPNRFTGVKGYYHDENGNQIVDYQWNSAETEIRTGFQNYPVYQNSRDEVNGDWTDQTWTYEMGAGKSGYAPEKIQPTLNSGKQNVRYPQRFRPQTFQTGNKRTA